MDGSAGSGNYYEAWPFLSFLTYNPDNFTGLGSDTIRQSFLQYSKGSNETPLHTFARLSTATSIQEVVGRYWARMAFGDIGHPTIQSVFDAQHGLGNQCTRSESGESLQCITLRERGRLESHGFSTQPIRCVFGPGSSARRFNPICCQSDFLYFSVLGPFASLVSNVRSSLGRYFTRLFFEIRSRRRKNPVILR